MFFQTHKGSVTSFSILFNFQGPVHRSLAADSSLIIPQKRFLSSSFLKFFVFLERVISYQSLGFRPDFYVLILVLPFYFSATLRSHSFVPHLVLEYNTTLLPSCQHFFTDFFKFFCIPPCRPKNSRLSAGKACCSISLYNIGIRYNISIRSYSCCWA